jgi:hypothetical protein
MKLETGHQKLFLDILLNTVHSFTQGIPSAETYIYR